MPSLRPAATAVLRSRWLPVLLVLLAAAACLHWAADVSLRDIAAFTGYAVGWLMMPGTLAWRLLDREGSPRPLVADLSIGMLCGYVLEAPVYLLCLIAGHPHAYVLWPVIVLLATLTHRRGRALWTKPTTRLPLWWSWSVAALIGYVLLWFVHDHWLAYPHGQQRLGTLYVDQPFHLMLATELRYHFPAQFANVAGQHLYYHWLSHLHIAASSWVTGNEPIVLIEGPALPTVFVTVAVALASIAVRLTKLAWTGPVAILLLCVTPATLTAWQVSGWAVLDGHFYGSPSAGFTNAALLVGMLICIETLTGRFTGPLPYVAAAVMFVAMLGAKSTSLPVVGAGLVVVALWRTASERRLHRPAAILTVLAGICYLVATPFFFGSGSGGLKVDFFGFYGDGPVVGRGIATVVLVLGYLSIAGCLVAQLARRRGRDDEILFLGGIGAAGFGAFVVLHQQSQAEYYFMYVSLVPLALGSTLSLARITRALPLGGTQKRVLARSLVGLLATSAVAAYLVSLVPDHAVTGALTRAAALKTYALPAVVVMALVAALVAVWQLGIHRRLALGGSLLLTGLVAVTGVGAAAVPATLVATVRHPMPTISTPDDQDALIGTDGVAAARWLRAHSDPDTLVATNAHCKLPGAPPCAEQNFWMAGYSERRFLIEGWSYIQRTGNTISGAFWDPQLLQQNDAAFADPTRSDVERLVRSYGVRWLFVDTRYTVRLHALDAIVKPAYRAGDYAIYDLRQPLGS